MPDDGDQWVSWEQMVATLRAKGEAEGRAALLAREVIELRGEVAKFKPLEMILAKGGDPVQHLSEAVLDLSAKVRSMEESSRLDQSEILRLTRCVAEVIHARLMVAKIDVQGMQSLADSITDQEMRDPDNAEKVWCEKINAWFCEHSSAIPADRVLGDGMVGVDREEWAATQDLLAQARCAAHAVEDDGQCDMTGICRAVFACDSLRANQGGAAT